MQQVKRKMWGETGWGMPTSVAVHLVLAFLLLVRLPEHGPPAKEQSVNVELVPPPSQAEEKPPEEVSKPRSEPARAQPQAFESASARLDREKPTQPQLPPAAPNRIDDSPPKPEQPPSASAEAEGAEEDEPSAIRTAPAELRVEANEAVTAAADAVAPPSAPVPEAKPTPKVAKADKAANPEQAVSERQAPALQEAQELYSKDALSDPRVKQAIGRLPPKRRIVQLCTIEALEQVRRQRPDAFPDMLVPFGPSEGFVSPDGMSANGGAFRSRGKWYSVDFKCEVDTETTSVVSFSYAIGKAIPKSEWAGRQLPRE
ncbi:hypothetical protein SJ05684_b44550 (plasmid) [Sinorhizobium sojae CCBAU 05684]|uniref:DUF930 domain-containing protein n=1 Tax=Sinorhizobium sojae CCBAU 05684 TaxID=716928 RepID=A0A249PI65_9HYPH|nr:DUF930 domain-containing protein [Sinorhizobium sojae]ASY65437.1 hypothetical protein SJ05684_b44550 [Sinorhizobium sojae CCBAU 05684]